MNQNVLIIKMSALGDLFIALPHIGAILSAHEGDRVTLLTSPGFVELFAHHPGLETVKLNRQRLVGWQSAWGRTLWVRRQKFDVVYDLQGNRISRRLVRFSKAAKRVGTQPKRIYTHCPAAPYTRDTQMNVFQRLNETLVSGGLAGASSGFELQLAPEVYEEVAAFKTENRLPESGYVALHAGSAAAWPSKRWPEANFAALARRLTDAGWTCVWVGGPDDRDLNRRLAQKVGIDATMRFSIGGMYVFGRGARFAVTSDSGPMHILGATGIPVFAFFGPTSRKRSHTAGQERRAFCIDVPCSPCFKGVCPPEKAHACMTGIDPEDVFTAIMNDIGRPPGP